MHTTKKARTKRVDVRADYRKRTKATRLAQGKATIQDMRVTKVQKGERKEREVTNHSKMRSHDALSSADASYVRSLRKKLREIEVLMEKQAAGEDLNESQLMKVEKLNETIEKLQQFNKKKGGNQRSGEEDEDEEEEEDEEEDDE